MDLALSRGRRHRPLRGAAEPAPIVAIPGESNHRHMAFLARRPTSMSSEEALTHCSRAASGRERTQAGVSVAGEHAVAACSGLTKNGPATGAVTSMCHFEMPSVAMCR